MSSPSSPERCLHNNGQDHVLSPNDADWKPTRQLRMVFTALCVLLLAVSFDSSSLSVALAVISADLHGTALQAFWAVTSFLLASAVFQPTVASLSEMFGRKYLVYLTCLLFGAGSLMGGLANNFAVLIAARVLQGVGSGGLNALAEVIVTDLVPLAHRGKWLSLISSSYAIGSVIGPLIGAGFTEHVTWRWVFWINLPIIVIGLGLVTIYLNQDTVPGAVMTKLRRFDWIGSVLFTATAGTFLFGLTSGGVMYAWASVPVILALVLGALGLVAFAFFEFKVAKEPIMHPALFNNYDMIASYIMTTFNGAILWSVVYFMILYYQAVQVYGPIISSLAALPETLTVAPGAVMVGIIAGKTGKYLWVLRISWLLTILGCGLLYILGPHTSVPAWIFLNIPIGLGTGMAINAITLAIQAACKPEHNAAAAAFNPFLRTFGQAVGISVSGAVLQNVFKKELLKLPKFANKATEYSRDATAFVEVIRDMSPGGERLDLQWAYVRSLRVNWLVMLGFATICTILSFTVKGYSLSQTHVTKQGLQQKNPQEKGKVGIVSEPLSSE